MYRTIRVGRNKYDVFRVFQNDTNETAVRVILGPRDRWVGFDYWRYVETLTLSPLQRGIWLMAKLEQRRDTARWLYRLAQKTTINHLLNKRKVHKL